MWYIKQNKKSNEECVLYASLNLKPLDRSGKKIVKL